jgi:hypothetical protein
MLKFSGALAQRCIQCPMPALTTVFTFLAERLHLRRRDLCVYWAAHNTVRKLLTWREQPLPLSFYVKLSGLPGFIATIEVNFMLITISISHF